MDDDDGDDGWERAWDMNNERGNLCSTMSHTIKMFEAQKWYLFKLL